MWAGRRPIGTAVMTVLLAGCGTVTVQPPLNSSLGWEALRAVGDFRKAPVHVGIFIDPGVRDLAFEATQSGGPAGQAVYTIRAGQAIAAKVVKLALLTFEGVSLVERREDAPPLLLQVTLQQEQPTYTLDVQTRGNLYEVVARADVRLRASLADRGDTIWVGTARVTDELRTGGVKGSGLGNEVVDISRAISETTDIVTDRLVADLMRQARRSDGLRRYLEAQRQ
jgi:hypothetical protein